VRGRKKSNKTNKQKKLHEAQGRLQVCQVACRRNRFMEMTIEKTELD